MKIKIAEINDRKTWENFVLSQPNNSFFQSWAWGEVEKNVKGQNSKIKDVWRLGIYDSSRLVGVGQVVKVAARRGVFLHLRHGPILKAWKEEYFDRLLKNLKELGEKEKAWFIRVTPLIEKNTKNQEFFKTRGFRPAPIPGQDAEDAWILKLTPSEDSLLAGMRKTTRYLIRKAQKLEIMVVEGKKEADFIAFFRLYRKTAQRQSFVPHKGLREEWEILGRERMARLYLAKHQGKVLAAALIIFYGRQAVYHHSGADLSEDIPASYGLLWEAIRQARKDGKEIFNFWGIAPEDKPRHPWQGLTMFKKGFGGEVREYIHAFDLPMSPFYRLTYLVEMARRIWRGY